MQSPEAWLVAAVAIATAEVLLGTQLYLLALAIGAAMVAGTLWTGVLDASPWGGWQATVLSWCAASAVIAWAVRPLHRRMARQVEDPNAPLGRSRAVAGYEAGEAAEELGEPDGGEGKTAPQRQRRRDDGGGAGGTGADRAG